MSFGIKGPPSSPPIDFTRLTSSTRITKQASLQNRVTEKARLRKRVRPGVSCAIRRQQEGCVRDFYTRTRERAICYEIKRRIPLWRAFKSLWLAFLSQNRESSILRSRKLNLEFRSFQQVRCNIILQRILAGKPPSIIRYKAAYPILHPVGGDPSQSS